MKTLNLRISPKSVSSLLAFAGTFVFFLVPFLVSASPGDVQTTRSNDCQETNCAILEQIKKIDGKLDDLKNKVVDTPIDPDLGDRLKKLDKTLEDQGRKIGNLGEKIENQATQIRKLGLQSRRSFIGMMVVLGTIIVATIVIVIAVRR